MEIVVTSINVTFDAVGFDKSDVSFTDSILEPQEDGSLLLRLSAFHKSGKKILTRSVPLQWKGVVVEEEKIP